MASSQTRLTCSRRVAASGHRASGGLFPAPQPAAAIILTTLPPSSGDHGEPTWCRSSSCCRGRASSAGSAGDARGSTHVQWIVSAGAARERAPSRRRAAAAAAAAAAPRPPPRPRGRGPGPEHPAPRGGPAGGHAGALEVAQSSSTEQLRRSRYGQGCLQRYAAVHRIIGRHRGFRLMRLPSIKPATPLACSELFQVSHRGHDLLVLLRSGGERAGGPAWRGACRSVAHAAGKGCPRERPEEPDVHRCITLPCSTNCTRVAEAVLLTQFAPCNPLCAAGGQGGVRPSAVG